MTIPDTQELVKRLRNARVQARYDELMREGKHGHYETLFRVVREEVDLALQQERERYVALEEVLYPFAQVAKGLPEEFDNRASNMLPVTLFTGAHEPDYQSHRIGRVIIYDLRRAASVIRSNDPGKTG